MNKPLLTLILIVVNMYNCFSQWNLVPTGSLETVTDVQMATGNIGYYTIGFPNSLLVKTIDGGDNWLPTGTTFNAFQSLQATGTDTVWALTAGGFQYSYNASLNWQNASFNNSFDNLYSFHFPTHQTGYLTGMNTNWDSILVYKTTNGGQNWNLIKQLDGYAFTDVFFTDANTGFLVSENNVYKTTDGGINWTIEFTQMGLSFQDIFFPDSQNGYCIGTLGDFLKTTDGGNNWISYPNVLLQNDPFWTSSDLHFINKDTGYVTSSYNQNGVPAIQKTYNGGLTWSSSYAGTNGFECISFLNDSIGWAGGGTGLLVRFDKSGTSTEISDFSENDFFVAENSSDYFLAFSDQQKKIISVFEISGKLISQTVSEDETILISKNTLQHGIYIIRIQTETKTYSRKISVRK